MNRIFLLVIFTFLTITCQNDKKVIIKGKIDGGNGETLFLEDFDLYESRIIDSVRLKKNGSFYFKQSSRIPRYYQLDLNGKRINLLAEPPEKIVVNSNVNNFFSDAVIKGSEGSVLAHVLGVKLAACKNQMKRIEEKYNMLLKEGAPDTTLARLEDEYQKVLSDHHHYSVKFVLENYNSLASIIALFQQIEEDVYVFNSVKDLQYFKIVTDSLTKKYHNLKYVKILRQNFTKFYSDYQSSMIMSRFKPEVVSLFDIALPGIAGDTMRLSELKGKYTLLYFWASGVTDISDINVSFINVYNKYKNRGFEIYQVSLDKSFENWKAAVRFDELPWINVCDSSFPASRVMINYNVKDLPTTYLINKEQTDILGKNLTASQLDISLGNLLK